jgi:hypothetical protein
MIKAKFNAKGSFTLDLQGKRAVIFGNIAEGKINKGMRVVIPLEAA